MDFEAEIVGDTIYRHWSWIGRLDHKLCNQLSNRSLLVPTTPSCQQWQQWCGWPQPQPSPPSAIRDDNNHQPQPCASAIWWPQPCPMAPHPLQAISNDNDTHPQLLGHLTTMTPALAFLMMTIPSPSAPWWQQWHHSQHSSPSDSGWSWPAVHLLSSLVYFALSWLTVIHFLNLLLWNWVTYTTVVVANQT